MLNRNFPTRPVTEVPGGVFPGILTNLQGMMNDLFRFHAPYAGRHNPILKPAAG